MLWFSVHTWRRNNSMKSTGTRAIRMARDASLMAFSIPNAAHAALHSVFTSERAKESTSWRRDAPPALAGSFTSQLRANHHASGCAIAWSASAAPAPSSATKRGSAASRRGTSGTRHRRSCTQRIGESALRNAGGCRRRAPCWTADECARGPYAMARTIPPHRRGRGRLYRPRWRRPAGLA